LSVEAFQETVMDVWPMPLVDTPVGVDGGVVSGHAAVVPATVVLAERLPAASYASTASVYEVPQASPLRVYAGAVGVAASVPFEYTP
jgi:hypothetical protein